MFEPYSKYQTVPIVGHFSLAESRRLRTNSGGGKGRVDERREAANRRPPMQQH
jgi:hypothetical protein